MKSTKVVVLKKGREKSLMRRHPWVFSGAVKECEKGIAPGETVRLTDYSGNFIAFGSYSPVSNISVRVWSFEENEVIDADFFDRMIGAASGRRKALGFTNDNRSAYRIVHGESDGLPGIIADYYAGFVCVQLLSCGAEFWKKEIVRALCQHTSCKGIYERSDTSARAKEGLHNSSGHLSGEMPPDNLIIEENGISLYIDIINGHKTGYYLDQRESRKKLTDYVRGASVLNCFAYTGGFGHFACKGEASFVTHVEISESAVKQIEKIAELNGFSDKQFKVLKGDVFNVMRDLLEQKQSFDVIVLDPPKFADSRFNIKKAARGYKDINMLAFKLLKPFGILLTFTCSGSVDELLFQKIVAGAALDAERDVSIISYLGQAEDHPVDIAFPEGRYLKGIVCQCRK